VNPAQRKNKKVNGSKLSSEDPRIGIGKTNKLIALITAVVALLVSSMALSAGAWGEGRDQVSVAAQSTSSYPQSQPPAGFQSKFAEVNGFRMHYLRVARVHLW
jgi:hypothetical protein